MWFGTVSLSCAVFPCLPALLCCLFRSISKLWLKSLHYLISLPHTSSSGPGRVSSHPRPSQSSAGADRRGHCPHAPEDTEDCLVLNGNISLWLSHAGAHSAGVAFLLSPQPQPDHCPVCACVETPVWIRCEWASCVPRAAVDFRVGISLQFLPPPLFIHHCWLAPAGATSPLHAPTPWAALLSLPARLECCADTAAMAMAAPSQGHSLASLNWTLGRLSYPDRRGSDPGPKENSHPSQASAERTGLLFSGNTAACLIPASQAGLPPATRRCVILKSIITSNHPASADLTPPFVS